MRLFETWRHIKLLPLDKKLFTSKLCERDHVDYATYTYVIPYSQLQEMSYASYGEWLSEMITETDTLQK